MKASLSCALLLGFVVACSSDPGSKTAVPDDPAGSGGHAGALPDETPEHPATGGIGAGGASGGGENSSAGAGGESATANAEVSFPEAVKRGTALNQKLVLKLDGEAVTGDLSWEIVEGTLPNGVHLSSEGVLSGTPSEAGTFEFQLKLTGANISVVVEVSWEIAATRWLAYVDEAVDDVNVYLLDTAEPNAKPIPLFDAEANLEDIVGRRFSPDGKFLSLLAKTADGNEAYLVEVDGDRTPQAITHNSLLAPIWSPSGKSYAHLEQLDSELTKLYVNGVEISDHLNLTNFEFIDERYLIVATETGNTDVGFQVVDIEQKKIVGGGGWGGGASSMSLRGSLQTESGIRFLVSFMQYPLHPHYYVDTSANADEVVTFNYDMYEEGAFSSDRRWAVLYGLPGSKLKNYVTGEELELEGNASDGMFSGDARWFVDLRSMDGVPELIYVDFQASPVAQVPLTIDPEVDRIYGFCPGGHWVAAGSDAGHLYFVDLSENKVHLASTPDLHSYLSFTCAPDGSYMLLTAQGTADKYTLRLYDAEKPADEARNLLATLPGSAFIGSPQFSPDSALIGFRSKKDSVFTLHYAAVDDASSKLTTVTCANETACARVSWFGFQP